MLDTIVFVCCTAFVKTRGMLVVVLLDVFAGTGSKEVRLIEENVAVANVGLLLQEEVDLSIVADCCWKGDEGGCVISWDDSSRGGISLVLFTLL